MSVWCHICGPVKYEAPTVLCAPCALGQILEEVRASGPVKPLFVRTLSDAYMDRIIKGVPL